MNLHETLRELTRLAEKEKPKTPVVIQRDTKYGTLKVPVSDVRFDGAQIVIVEEFPSW